MTTPLRVLCIFSTLDRGGAESMCMNIYRHIDREKVQFDFVKHTANKGAYEDEITALGGRIFEAPRYKVLNHVSYMHWWFRFLNSHPEYWIIHGHYFTVSAIYFKVAKQCGRITVAHSHATNIEGEIKSFLVKQVEKQADYCFACAETAGKWLFPHHDFTVLKNAIDLSVFAFDPTVRQKYRKDFNLDEKYVLGTVANFSAVKNPIGLIDIFHAVHMKDPQTKLLWIGDGGLRREIEQKLLDEMLSDSVILTGVRSDVPSLLQAMDCFLLPSFNEGLPVVLIEAQAAGLPCFVSDTVTREADITGLCHYLPLDNPKVWADAILNDHTPREDTSKKIIDAGYDIHTTAKWLEDFYIRISEEYKEG